MKDPVKDAIQTAIEFGKALGKKEALENHTCPVCEYNPSKAKTVEGKSVYGLSGTLEGLALKQLDSEEIHGDDSNWDRV